jgi:hypothetical protein
VLSVVWKAVVICRLEPTARTRNGDADFAIVRPSLFR